MISWSMNCPWWVRNVEKLALTGVMPPKDHWKTLLLTVRALGKSCGGGETDRVRGKLITIKIRRVLFQSFSGPLHALKFLSFDFFVINCQIDIINDWVQEMADTGKWILKLINWEKHTMFLSELDFTEFKQGNITSQVADIELNHTGTTSLS